MNSRKLSVTLECFVKKDGKYLMLHRSPQKRIMPDVWMAPGGHVEFNEGIFTCARREILEETGLSIKNIRLKVIGNGFLKDLQEEYLFHMLVADYAGGTLTPKNEDGEFVWLTPEEILKLPKLLAELHKVFPHILSTDDSVISYRSVFEAGNNMVEFEYDSP
jgi:8-oxo-dGTP diphosphatase